MNILQVIVLLCCSTAGTAHAAVMLSVVPSSQTVPVGSSMSVDVNISGFGAGTAPSLGTFDVTVDYDPAVLSYSFVAFGPGLDVLGLGSIQSVLPGFGTVNLFELSLDTITELNSFQQSSFSLFTLGFTVAGAGTSLISLSVNALGDAEGSSLLATIQNGSVTADNPHAIPEPRLGWIVGVVVACLGWTQRRTGPRLGVLRRYSVATDNRFTRI